MTTGLVPSITVPSQGGAVPQQHQGNASRLLPPSGGSLGQQAMQNAPMQLLPKATGLPALHYFDQFIYPLFSLSALSATVLQQKYECYIKPGRNNILELAMAIGLQLQGILLACPDKGQANTAEGRIFKAFLQTSRQQPEQRQQQGGDKSGSSQNDVSKVSIDSVKGWIEPARHRSRAKDIVKHVMMRRCLKSGFDYDDVIETSLLGYYHLLRGDVSGFHVCIGNTQRQLALLDIQQNPRDAALWSKQDMRVLQAKATAMDHLHPIKFYSRVGSSTSTSKDEQIVDNDFALVQEKLSELASFVQSASLQVSEGNSLDVEVDNRLSTLRRDLPDRLQQPTICSEWITITCERVDSDWISDMIRGDSMTPSLRLNVYLNICFVRLVARQRHLLRALDATEKQEGSRSTPLESGLLKSIRQVDHISTSMISSTLLAFTVFPHLICLSQLFAAELTASAWNYIVAQLVLLDSALNEQRQVMQEGLKKMEDKLTPLIEYLAASQEKESWPFAASLGMVRSIIQAARESEAGATECLDTLRRFNIAHSQAFSRILKGNACAVEELRKQTMSTTIATDKDNDNNNKKTATIPP